MNLPSPEPSGAHAGLSAEHLLRESQILLAGVLDSSLDGIAALRAVRDQAGLIVDFTWLLVNRRAETILGRTAADLVGKGLMETLPGNRDLGLFESYVRVVETREPAEHEFRYEADAIRGWFQNIAAPFGDGFTVTFRDITRQKEAEEARLALAAARMGIWEVNAATREVIGSRGTWELFGFAPDERGRTIDEFLACIHPDDRERVLEAIVAPPAGGPAHIVEFRVQLPEQAARWLISRGAIVDGGGGQQRFAGVLTEITERRLAEDRARQLLEATSALAAALTADDVVRVVLDQGMQALDARAASVSLLSADGATVEFIGQRGYPPPIVADFGRVPVAARNLLSDTVREGRAHFFTGREILAHYPEVAPAQALMGGSSACLPLQAGERTLGSLALSFADERAFSPGERTFLGSLAGLCAQALDRAALYEQERASRADAEEALRVRDQFLTAAAHELKTPLTVLLGSAGLLARRVERAAEPDSASARAARSVAAQVLRVDRLINLMLEVSSLQTGALRLHRAPLDLARLVANTVADLQPTLAGQDLALQVSEAVWVVGDGTWLERVVQELLDNAVRYSSPSGTIGVAVLARGGEAVLEVSDDGIGIPAEALSRVFERFYRAPNVDLPNGISGLGLGLYVARTVAEGHGGSIAVRHGPQGGTIVEMRVPLRAAEPAGGGAGRDD